MKATPNGRTDHTANKPLVSRMVSARTGGLRADAAPQARGTALQCRCKCKIGWQQNFVPLDKNERARNGQPRSRPGVEFK